MPTLNENAFPGTQGQVQAYQWAGSDEPRYVVVIAHGYGEKARCYDGLAAALVADGAVVYAPDHHGHGRSEGERSVVTDVENLVTDFGTVIGRTTGKHGLPTVLVGQGMGGLVATRFAQQHPEHLVGLVLCGDIRAADADAYPGAGTETLGAIARATEQAAAGPALPLPVLRLSARDALDGAHAREILDEVLAFVQAAVGAPA